MTRAGAEAAVKWRLRPRSSSCSGRAKPLAREGREAAKTADEAKEAAATAAREAAPPTASLRKLDWLKPRADVELALGDTALATSVARFGTRVHC
jgi:hypothetical protein